MVWERMQRPVALSALALGLLAMVALAAATARNNRGDERAPTAARTPTGTHYLSTRGSDRGPGTRRRPWRRLEHALRRSRPGWTLVLEPGIYGASGTTIEIRRSGTPARPVTLMSAPNGGQARIQGLVRVTASHVRLRRLHFDGPTGPVRPRAADNDAGEEVPLAIYGRDVAVTESEIEGSAWHAGIYLEGVEGAQVLGNYIHDNGNRSDSAQANLDHGIYWSSGSGVIANNVITRNVARGIQLYPDAAGVEVLHNTIVGNGRAGVQLGENASQNLIMNNIVTSNGDAGVRSHALRGVGNRVATNLLWRNGGDDEAKLAGLEVTDTSVGDPMLDDDWCPAAESPAVDHAAASRVRLDRSGRPRGQSDSRPDIGACERRP